MLHYPFFSLPVHCALNYHCDCVIVTLIPILSFGKCLAVKRLFRLFGLLLYCYESSLPFLFWVCLYVFHWCLLPFSDILSMMLSTIWNGESWRSWFVGRSVWSPCSSTPHVVSTLSSPSLQVQIRVESTMCVWCVIEDSLLVMACFLTSSRLHIKRC